MCVLVLLSGQLFVTALTMAAVTEAPVQGQLTASQLTPSVASAPPEDPLFPQDIGAWTYTPEFAEWFKRMKLKEPGPTGAYAVNFQVHQVEELDRCVFNVFLDNTLPIDYPEGPVGFLPFTYPGSWAFLKLSPEDKQAVDAAYFAKYRDPRVILKHSIGEEPLTVFQYRASLYSDVAVLTLTVDCNHVGTMKGALRMQLKTTGAQPHEITIPEHFPLWIDATLKKSRRPAARLNPEGLSDRDVWSYTPEFGKRFGLPVLSEPGPTGAQAVAWRVENYRKDDQACFLDVYVNDTVELILPESEVGFLGPQLGVGGYFLVQKDMKESKFLRKYRHGYSDIHVTHLFATWELTSERERKQYEGHAKALGENVFRHLGGNRYRVGLRAPLDIEAYRKYAFPGLSYFALNLGCMTPPSSEKGPVGASMMRKDGVRHDILLGREFYERLRRDWMERHEIPFKRGFPLMYPEAQKETTR